MEPDIKFDLEAILWHAKELLLFVILFNIY